LLFKTLLMPVQLTNKTQRSTAAENFIKAGKVKQFEQIFWN